MVRPAEAELLPADVASVCWEWVSFSTSVEGFICVTLGLSRVFFPSGYVDTTKSFLLAADSWILEEGEEGEDDEEEEEVEEEDTEGESAEEEDEAEDEEEVDVEDEEALDPGF